MNRNCLLPLALVLLLGACSERPAPGTALPGSGAAPSAASAPAPATVPMPPSAQFHAITDAGALLALPASGTCSLENTVNLVDNSPSPGAEPNSYAVLKNGGYKLIGFATDSDAGTVPATIQLLLHGQDSSYVLAGATGSERPDVAAFFKKPGMTGAGYQLDAAFAGVAPGAYEVYVVKGEGAARALCPTHQMLSVR